MVRFAVAVTIAFLASPTFAAEGDPAKGEALYAKNCELCHSFGSNKVGPDHCGVFGRKTASMEYPSYSDGMKKLNATWDVALLNKFLADPLGFIPDTYMGFTGLADETARMDLIAYLAKKGSDPAVCKN